MDEYVDLPRDHPQSYHSFMWNHLFKHIDIQPKNVHILNGNAADLQKECEDYEAKIKSFGGIELFLGGIGTDGHIGWSLQHINLHSLSLSRSPKQRSTNPAHRWCHELESRL